MSPSPGCVVFLVHVPRALSRAGTQRSGGSLSWPWAWLCPGLSLARSSGVGSACSQMPPAASSELLEQELDVSGRAAATAVQTCPEVNGAWGEECL